jgi:hypothetical protein
MIKLMSEKKLLVIGERISGTFDLVRSSGQVHIVVQLFMEYSRK